MRIGIDFDNTIVCYDALFHRLALERSLIPDSLAADKQSVRDYLRQHGQEQAWTELQGFAYGTRILEATPFPGVLDFLAACRRVGASVYVVSHKTRHPIRGPQTDLHQAARGWLRIHGFFDRQDLGLPRNRVFFEETTQAKMRRIADERCTHFVDDLAEFLSRPEFPDNVYRVLFDPWERSVGKVPFCRVSSWNGLRTELLNEPSA
jgi:hypothetical protein